jgi:hypothetical protein
VAYAIASRTPAPVPLGPLRPTAAGGADGVRFTLGAFERGDPVGRGSAVRVAERLVLELLTARGGVEETLTPPGGARELMPGEYAYTLSRATLRRLPRGRYRFRARAWAPRQRSPTTGRSPPFAR